MRESVARFLGSLEQERNFSANTVSAYRNDLNQFVAYLNDELRVAGWAEVNEDTLRRYQADLLERRYKDSTKARKTAAIKSFCGYMVTQGELRGDPTSGLVSPRVEKYVPKAMTEAQARALLQAPGGKSGPEGARDRAMLHALYATGMRVSELVSLNVDDVDLAEGVVCCTGKQERRRTVPLGAAATEALRAYLFGPRGAIARGFDDTALFLNHRGRRLTRQGFWLILKEYAEVADMRDITPHTLRHSFATHAITHGSDLGDVQRILGHVSIATTQVYQRIATEMREQERVADPGNNVSPNAHEPELAQANSER